MTFLGVVLWSIAAGGLLIVFVHTGDGLCAGLSLYCALMSVSWRWGDE